MVTTLVYGLVLAVAAVLSARLRRSVLSAAVLFLVVGIVVGRGGFGLIDPSESDSLVTLVEVTLFTVLFTDGMLVGSQDLRSAWRLPGRALLLGLPLTFALTAALGRGLLDMAWLPALLLAAILTPTDPVFASAIVGREEVPWSVRRVLNVESGLNDGLALPVVLVLVDRLGDQPVHPGQLALQIVGGVAIGIVVPLLAVRLERLERLAAVGQFEALYAVAIGVVTFGLAGVLGANEFLAAFAAGMTLRTLSPRLVDAFSTFGDLVEELLKLLAILVFGALLTRSMLTGIGWVGWAFAALVLVAVRPLSIAVALFRSRLDRPETVVVAWFGPKGFASVLYGLLVLERLGDQGLFAVVAATVALSIVVHSSSDVPIANWFGRAEDEVADDDATAEQDAEQQTADRSARASARGAGRGPDGGSPGNGSGDGADRPPGGRTPEEEEATAG